MNLPDIHTPPAARFRWWLAFWLVVTPVCAIPSILLGYTAAGHEGFDIPGVIAGIVLLASGLAWITSRDWFARAVRRKSVRRGFWLVLGLRLAICTVGFPVGIVVDLVAGVVPLVLMGLVVSPWVESTSDDAPVLRPFDGQPLQFLFILAMTLVQGATVGAAMAALTTAAAEVFREMFPEPLGTIECEHCGYDLRATPGRCPECGKVPEAVRVARGLVGRGGGADNPRP